jgi:DNA-binding LytR/AlgR family response regulator
MIQIAICDDNALELKNTNDIVQDFAKAAPGTDISVRTFTSAFELVDYISARGGFHIYLLDILMPNINGIKVGESIREKDDLAVIIYLTSSADYALKSFGVYAFQYLLKPVSASQLHGVLNKAFLKIDQEKQNVISLKTKDGISVIRYHQIISVEYSNHCLRFYLSDGTTAVSVCLREPFETTANELQKDRRFVRPHVSFVINMRYVRTITSKGFSMTNGSFIAISRKNYTEIKKKYIDFLLSQGDPTIC